MLQIIKTIPEHFYNMEIQKEQAFCREHFNTNPNYAKILCEQGIARTGITSDGIVVGVMGLAFHHKNSAEGWGILSTHFRQYARYAIPAVRQVLKEYSHVKRIQVTASVEFPEAHKLLTKSFGFKPEGILECWDCLGNDHILYTIINNSIDWSTR